MYFTHLPNHKDRTFDESLHFSKFRKHNIIFNAESCNSYCEEHVGCLSVKTVLRGEEWYKVNGNWLAVRPGQFLLLNNNQQYSCRIDGPERTKVFSVFFSDEFSASVYRDSIQCEKTLLETPFESGKASPEFFQTLYNVDTELQGNLSGLMASLSDGADNNIIDQPLVFLLRYLIRSQKPERERANNVHALKAPTRKEIYKRLCIAKDFLHSSFMDSPSLSSISNTACLSVPQLVRQFRACFNTTPHQYLTQLKLAHALKSLKDSNSTIQEITLKCGFENTSAFCRLFKSHYKTSPAAFRRMPRKN